MGIFDGFGGSQVKLDAPTALAWLIATPEVGSFEVKPAQRFVLLGSDGLWRGFSGQQAVDKTFVRLNQMDARRAEIDAAMGDEARLALKTPEQVKSMATPLPSP